MHPQLEPAEVDSVAMNVDERVTRPPELYPSSAAKLGLRRAAGSPAGSALPASEFRGVLITPSGGGYLLHPVSDYRALSARPPSAGGNAIEQVVLDVAPERATTWLKRAGWGLALVIAMLGSVWGYGAAHAKKAPALVLGMAEARDIETTVTATGALEAVTAIDVGAQVTGRVLEIYVEENESVRKGQVLARLDAEELQASVAQGAAQVAGAAASVDLAWATLAEARLTLSRVDGLSREGVASHQELEAARANAARSQAAWVNARAQAALARATLHAAESKRDKSTIVSPIDGIVLTRMVERGQTVTAGFQTPVLFRIAQDLTQMRLRVELDEADVAKVRAGQSASFTVAAFPERQFQARVVRVSHDSRIAGNVVVFGATLELDNSEQLLRPGMTCTVTVITDQRHGVLSVPNAALGLVLSRVAGPAKAPLADEAEPGAEARVWTVENGEPVSIRVSTGLRGDEYTEIAAGELKLNDSVIVEEPAP